MCTLEEADDEAVYECEHVRMHVWQVYIQACVCAHVCMHSIIN